jgi:hypothetical protein
LIVFFLHRIGTIVLETNILDLIFLNISFSQVQIVTDEEVLNYIHYNFLVIIHSIKVNING